jgi:hypothetical protein
LFALLLAGDSAYLGGLSGELGEEVGLLVRGGADVETVVARGGVVG